MDILIFTAMITGLAHLFQIFPHLLHSGTRPGMSYLEQRRIIAVNIAGLAGGTCSLAFLVSNILTHYYVLCVPDILTMLAGYSMPLFHKWGYQRYPAVIAVVLYSLCSAFSAYTYHNSTEYFLLLFMGVSFVIWDDMPRLTLSLALLDATLFFLLEINPHAAAQLAVPGWNKAVVLVIILSLYLYFLNYFRELNRSYRQRIERKNGELQQLNLHKEQILSVLSHDIRSPVAGVYSTLCLLKDGLLNQEKSEEITDQLLTSVGNLQLSITGLLEWSKSQMSDPQPRKTVFALSTIITDILRFLSFQSTAKQIVVDTAGVQDVALFADYYHTEIILRNLVSNAIKFSYPGNVVRLQAETAGLMAVIRVSDTGKGITAENLVKLFDPHELLTTHGTDNEKGNGLGLKLCHQFARLNDGDLTVESLPGEGTTCAVYLPLAPR